MSAYYFPSCKFKAKYPTLHERIAGYMWDTWEAQVAGCCRASLKKCTAVDRVIVICNTCTAFFTESGGAGEVLSLWELLLTDESFPFPDHRGKTVTLQDCWRSYENRPQQEAVREILKRMNVDVVELPDNFEKVKFCGYSLYEPLPAGYRALAPKRLGSQADGEAFFQAHTAEEKKALMEAHCATIPTEDVVCYCVSCAKGIQLGGKNAIHLAELVFGEYA